MKFKLPSINLKEINIWNAILVAYIVNILLSIIIRFANYGNTFLLALMIIYCYRKRRIRISFIGLGWALFLFIYPIFDNAFRSEYPLTLYMALNYLMLVIFILIADDDINKYSVTKAGLKLLAWFQVCGLLLSIVFERLYVVIAYRLLGMWSYNTRGFAADATVVAYIIAIGAGIYFFEFYTMKNKLSQEGFLKIFSVALMLITLVLTNKRSFAVAFVCALFICCVILSFRDKNKLIKTILTFVLITVIGVGISLFSYYRFGPTNALGRLGETIVGMRAGSDVTSMRTQWAEYMAEWSAGKEWFGIGWESFKVRIQETAYGTKVPNGHNVYRQILCEAGYVGVVQYVFMILATIVSSARNLMFFVKYEENSEEKTNVLFASITLFVVITFSIYSYFGNAIYDPPIFLPFFAMVAINQSLQLQRKWLQENAR